MATPYFGATRTLVDTDWNAIPDANHIGYFPGPEPGPETAMISDPFNSTGLTAISKTGLTQLRVRFDTIFVEKTDNWLGFYSGETPAKAPRLIVRYAVP